MIKIRLMSVVAATAILGLAACSGGEKKAEAPAKAAPVAEAPAAPAAPATEAAPAPEAAAPAATAEAAPPAAAPAAPAAAGGVVMVGGLTGDATRGEAVFKQCKTCHAIEVGVNKVGPSLHGIVGRTAGSIAGFRYSAANKASGVKWSEDVLFTYLENPRKFMPGTNMSFVGLRDPQKRADVIAYLKSQS